MSSSDPFAASIFSLVETLNHSKTGILVVGHGTRKEAGQREFLTLAEHIAALVPGLAVEASFLELATPDIATGVKRLATSGCQSLVVIPVLLFYAGHARTDIPDAVQEACKVHGLQFAGISQPLDTHPGAIELSEMRFRESIQSIELDMTRRIQDSVGLAMVGRGTSDESALERMREFTRIRCSRIDVRWNGTGFFAGGEPKVEQLLENGANSASSIVVVQPHLLFDGELMDQLRESVARWQSERPEQVWRLANTLGGEPALAKVFLSILAESWAEEMTDRSLRNR